MLDEKLGEKWKPGMLAMVSLLACVEKLCSIMNLVSVEKDWVSFLLKVERDLTDSYLSFADGVRAPRLWSSPVMIKRL